jgi:hypothetical protein
MSKQTINIGSAANDGTGDPLRTAFQKCNGNFDELYVGIDLSAYAPLASPVFTGNPTAPTPTAGDNDTSIATTAFVNTKAGNYLPLAGGTLTGNLTISSAGALVVQSTAASTSPTTGALTVAGGIGVGGKIYAGDAVLADIWSVRSGGTQGLCYFGNSGTKYLLYDGSRFFFTGAPLTVQDATASSSPTTGALTVAGGLGVSGQIRAGAAILGVGVYSDQGGGYGTYYFDNGGTKYLQSAGARFYLSGGGLEISDTTASTSPTTGALTVAGGIGVGGNIYVGGNGYKPAGGPWLDSSDARIKTVVSDYEHGLAEVLALTPKRYRYKGNDTVDPTTATKLPYEDSPHYSVAVAGTEYIGLIAQEVETVMPEMVTLASGYIDGTNKVSDLRTLDTGALIYALVNAVKELNARVQALEGAVV